MFLKIIKRTVNYWVDKKIIDDFDRDIYEYGFELVLSSVINIVVVIVMSIFIKKLYESIILLGVVIPLQSCGGGYHAKTHLNCFLIMYIGWWIVIQIIPYITLVMAIFTVIISLIIIFAVAPVTHENVPMSDKQLYKMKLLLRCFSVIIALIGIITSWYAIGNIGNSIIIGMGVVALSMLVAKFKKLSKKIK